MYTILNNKKVKVTKCNNLIDKIKAFIHKIKDFDYCLCFTKKRFFHTFFKLSNVDIVMTDKNNKILYLYQSLKPWKIISPKENVFYTYELAENDTKTFSLGDKFKIRTTRNTH